VLPPLLRSKTMIMRKPCPSVLHLPSHTKPTHIPNILGHINCQQDPVCLKRKQTDHTDCLHPAVIEPYAESCENKRIICAMLCNTSYEAAHSFFACPRRLRGFLEKKTVQWRAIFVLFGFCAPLFCKCPYDICFQNASWSTNPRQLAAMI